MISGEEVGNGFAPFDDDDVIGVLEVFLEVFGHETWVREAVEIIMNKTTVATRQSVGFGNSETGASDRLFDA